MMETGLKWLPLDGYSVPQIWATLICGKNPPLTREGTFGQAALNAERVRLNSLGYVNRMQVPDN